MSARRPLASPPSQPPPTTSAPAPTERGGGTRVRRRPRSRFQRHRAGALSAAGPWIAGTALLVVLWWAAALTAGGEPPKVPTPWAVADDLISERTLYLQNARPTLLIASQGYLLGNGAALLLGCCLAGLPRPLRRPTLGVVIIFHNLPVIALAPLLQILLTGNGPRIATAALWVFFPTLLGTMTGLTAADEGPLQVVRAAGGGPVAALVRVRAFYAVPSVFAAMAITIPYALIGAMVGEFLGGVDHGLGILLVQGLQDLNGARVWGIGLLVALIGALGLLAATRVSGLLFPWGASRSHTIRIQPPSDRSPIRAAATAIVQAGAALAVVLLIWVAAINVFALEPFVVRKPADVWAYLVVGPDASAHLHDLISALGTTLRLSLLGTALGLALGIVVALSAVRWRMARTVLMPVVLGVNSVPYLALVPILAVALGRGAVLSLALATLVALLPTVVNVRSAMMTIPREHRDLARVYGHSATRSMRYIDAPNLVPAIFVSLRLAAPFALYAVLFAEFLATGSGIGGRMVTDAIFGQYDAAWSAAVLVTGTSALLYLAVEQLEQVALRRFAPERTR